MDTLVFIDTNIWLDFYRVQGPKTDLAILDRVDDNRDRIITGAQVEMEFKKNRPRVILDSYAALKPPNLGSLTLPAYLARSRQSSGLETGKKRINEQLKALRSRTENIFSKPTRYDPVYKVAQRLFRHAGPCNLSRDRKERHSIRRLACKRFLLGYPPRKAGDTSIGDAVNWEWIVRCAKDTGADIVIVSRDSDFGVSFNGQPHLNEWLLQEFRERVSRKRSIALTNRLSEAFTRASIEVSQDEVRAEDRFLKERTENAFAALGNLRLGRDPFAAAAGGSFTAADLEIATKALGGQLQWGNQLKEVMAQFRLPQEWAGLPVPQQFPLQPEDQDESDEDE